MELLMIMFWSVLVALLLLWVLPKRTLRFLGLIHIRAFRPFSPNWITAYSAVFTIVGIILYTRHPILGFVVVVFAATLDRLDGKMAFVLMTTLAPRNKWSTGSSGQLLAPVTHFTVVPTDDTSRNNLWKIIRLLFAKRPNLIPTIVVEEIAPRDSRFNRWWYEFNFPGGTDLGEVFDPASDKVKSLSILIYFVFQGTLNPWLVCLLAATELFGTVIRRPFNLLQSHIGKTKATGVGKYKVMIQWLLVILCAPYHQHWIEQDHWAYGMESGLIWIQCLVDLLAIASVLSRFKGIRRHSEVIEVLDSLEKSTEHE